MAYKPNTDTMTKILEVETKGLTISESARILGMNFHTLNSVIKRYKIDWRGQRKQSNPAKKPRIIDILKVPLSCVQSIEIWGHNEEGYYGVIK